MSFRERLSAIRSERKRGFSPAPRNLGEVEIPPTRNSLLKWLYSTGVVEASPYSGHLSDKLFCYELLQEALPGNKLLARSCSLLEIGASPAERRARFPGGYVVKPTGEMDSNGEGLFLRGEDFFSAGNIPLADEAVNPITGLVSSGEKFFAQEALGAREGEFRLHTLEAEVIPNATFTRWDQEWDLAKFAKAEKELQDFLSALPAWVTARQAWSVDLMEKSDGSFGIVEINTNRGLERQWSGDMINPDVMQAYVLHLEAKYGAKLLGESGEIFRRAKADQAKYEEKFSEEARRRHAELKARYRS
jgi:hypothetical protein